jgi:hypothetical protein
MKASTVLGDVLRDFADLCDLHPEWDVFACLISKDGLRLNFNAVGNEAFPIDLARALVTACEVAAGGFDDSDLHPAPFEADGL